MALNAAAIRRANAIALAPVLQPKRKKEKVAKEQWGGVGPEHFFIECLIFLTVEFKTVDTP